MENANTLLKTDGLKKFYYTDEIETTALAGVNLQVKEGEFVLTAGNGSKAALIGRNKRRFEELKGVLQDSFGMDLKIV